MKKLFILIVIGCLNTACEEVIQLDLPTETPRLVIEASLEMIPNEPMTQVVKLSLTGGFYQEVNPAVTDAVVQLIDLTNNQTYGFAHNAALKGDYRLLFTPSFDTDYKLSVVYDNETYESTNERLMHAVPIDKLEQGNNTSFGGDEKEVLITYTDAGERDDFYLFDFGYQLFLATKDEFYQGNVFTFSYFFDDLEAGDVAAIKIMGIDERHFNFMTILINQTQDGGSPFDTTPSTVRGNLSNRNNPSHFPMGYFRLSETYNASLVLE